MIVEYERPPAEKPHRHRDPSDNRKLARGDRVRVNGETELRVPRNGDYFGAVEIEANRPGGARANIGVVDGHAYFDLQLLLWFPPTSRLGV